MQIAGYIAPDKDIALEQGVSFVYETQYGDITIRSKMAGRDNVQFRLAMQNFDQWMNRRRALSKGKADTEADKKLIGILYDNLVIAWSTTIKSVDDKGVEHKIEPTRDNFVDLLASPACEKVTAIFLEDARDDENFRALDAEATAGNSEMPSRGASTGQTEKTGSAK